MKKQLLTSGLVISGMGVMAQTTAATAAPDYTFQYVWLTIMGLLLMVLLLLVVTLKKVVYVLKIESSGGVYPVDEQTIWEKILSLKPLSSEKDMVLDHEFDGIRELNNPIPFWFNFLFGVSIVFAVVYMTIYHITGTGDLQAKEYDKELVMAEQKKQEYIKMAGNLIDENSVKVVTDKTKIESGAALFQSKCAVCHGDKGQGNVGPNLTDEYWLHGGDVQSIFKSIKYGIPSKGMVAWQNSMNGAQIEELTGFILAIQGTHPDGAKEPQGEKMEPTAVVDSTTVTN